MDKKKQSIPLGEFTDDSGQTWTAALDLVDGKEPVVHLAGDRGWGRSSYNLRQFLGIHTRATPFMVAGQERGEPDFTFPGSSTNLIAATAMQYITRLHGRFEIRWVPNDPRVPF